VVKWVNVSRSAVTETNGSGSPSAMMPPSCTTRSSGPAEGDQYQFHPLTKIGGSG
jgi:hypothetical protein